MSDIHAFTCTVSMTAAATPADIWALWVDVGNWSGWDEGIECSRLVAQFREGGTIELTPKGAGPVTVELKTVTQGEEFSDETVLPFGTLKNSHRLEPLGDRVLITHTVQALINADSVGFFEDAVWPHMQGGVAESLGQLISIAQAA
ncbi:SRPBCC family protein [Pseudomonas sp. KNUC1026]|uniref:SRPBCC family protein n=1 Tax=Pseudomonas sp. KNUC1026 TaxID=2893890 RepID=UPI001F254517|nr:SRPBCC family protein [Pseudomonas sp. KNUC1026]UFH50198.1 SRPBCC family protein [Pseudomonas sp. KNUC1026]